MFYICGCEAHFVIHLLQNSGSRLVCLRVRSNEPKKVLRGTWETPATFGFGAEAAQLPSRTTPPLRPALREETTMRMTAAGGQAGVQNGDQCCELCSCPEEEEGR